MKIKTKIAGKLAILLAVSFGLAVFFANIPIWAQTNGEINEINDKIVDKKKEIDALQKEIDAYAENIKAKQKEARGLKDQISLLENEIAKVNLSIEATTKRIEQTNLEIQDTNLQIQATEKQIASAKEKISEYLRLIYRHDQVSYIEVLLTNNSFSDFFDQIKYAEEIHTNLKDALVKFKKSLQDLDVEKSNLDEKIKQEEDLKDTLVKQKSELAEKNNAKEVVLLQTRLTERQYQNYLYRLQMEQQQINSDIVSLEKTVRKKLEELAKSDRFNSLGPAKLSWPVSPNRGITAYFHDPDYPFRYIYEHPGIDIRAAQSTAIKSPDSGYVARVKFAGNSSYAYIMILHNDGLSTVFGHVSAVYVKEDEYVTKGQSVGLSGGLPHSIGSGNLTTGPHLHFEVRLNGIPVNPLEYLPAI